MKVVVTEISNRSPGIYLFFVIALQYSAHFRNVPEQSLVDLRNYEPLLSELVIRYI